VNAERSHIGETRTRRAQRTFTGAIDGLTHLLDATRQLVDPMARARVRNLLRSALEAFRGRPVAKLDAFQVDLERHRAPV